MFKKPLRLVFFVFFFSIIFYSNALAAELNLPKTSVNPDKYLFFSIKRLVEKVTLYVQFSQESKVNYYKNLTLTRTSELKYVVENKLLGEVEKSTQRLSYQIGVLSDYIADNPKLSEKKTEISSFLIRLKSPLENLRDQYSANSSYWMLVQHSINSIDINLEKLK